MVSSDAVDELPLLTAQERREIVETWNEPQRADNVPSCIHELFEAQAARTPHAVALVFGDERVTYAELDVRANQLAMTARPSVSSAASRWSSRCSPC